MRHWLIRAGQPRTATLRRGLMAVIHTRTGPPEAAPVQASRPRLGDPEPAEAKDHLRGRRKLVSFQ